MTEEWMTEGRDMLHSPKLGVRSLTPGCSCRGSGSQELPVQEGCTPLVSCGTEDRLSLSECWLSRVTLNGKTFLC